MLVISLKHERVLKNLRKYSCVCAKREFCRVMLFPLEGYLVVLDLDLVLKVILDGLKLDAACMVVLTNLFPLS